MKTNFKFNFLQTIAAKKNNNEGFTLIELLVVVIIIGVLAAVALPNLLSQVGKARETEIKNAAGTVNRSQQAYHFEKQAFAPDEATLGIDIPTEYVDALNIVPNGAADATVAPSNADATDDGTRAYSGGIFYSGGSYTQILCQSDAVQATLAVPTDGETCASGTKVR